MCTLNESAALFVGDWDSLGMVHLEMPPAVLQPTVPFELDLYDGSAFVSLVFFTMRNMRLARGPRLLNILFYPFREQRFLNVRTYVRHQNEPGIHFISEWISSRLCVHLGPPLYSLPYRWGRHRMNLDANVFRATLTDIASKTALQCEIKLAEPFARCPAGSRDEFFFERYAAFNGHGPSRKAFRVWHAPWEQCSGEPAISDDSLLCAHFPWFAHVRISGANYSPGARDVRMSWPQRLNSGSRCPVELAKVLA